VEHREQAEKNTFIRTKPRISGDEYSGSTEGGEFVHKLRELGWFNIEKVNFFW
jgi:hypothetical protein